MDTNNTYVQDTQYPNKWSRKQVMILIGIVTSALVLFLGWQGYQATQFRVTGTDPKLGSVQTISAYIEVTFNRTLTDKNIKINDPGKIVSGYNLDDKSLRINLKPDTLKEGQKYSLAIASITSDKNETMTNKKLDFTAQKADFDSLSEAQQRGAIDTQDRFDYAPTTLPIDGDHELVERGITDSQLQEVRQAIFNFSKSVKKEFSSIRIYKASIDSPTNPDPQSSRATMFFTTDFDNETYRVQLDYFDLTGIQMYVRNPQTDAIVFDSGVLDSFEE